MTRGWRRATLGEVARWGSGGTPQAGNSAYYGGSIPWAVIGDLNDAVVTHTAASLTEDGLTRSSAKLVPRGAVLVAMYGSIGKLGIAGVPMATNQAIAFAVPHDSIDRDFLFYYLLGQRPNLDGAGKGATQRNIGQAILKAWPIRYPEIWEQRRIVAILEEQLSDLDDGERALASALRRLTGLRERRVLSALTGGADEERLAPSINPAGTRDGDLPALPVGWEWKRLGEVADVVGGVTKDSKKQSDLSVPEVPYLRVANVQRGRLDLTSIATIRVPEARARALALEPGDVLLNEGGDRDKLARGWVWEGQIEGCVHQNHVFRARVTERRLDPYFLSLTTNSLGASWAERNGKQSVNLASISLSMIRKMPVIVPPDGVAGRLVREIRDEAESFDRIQKAVDQAAARSSRLRRALLAAAFSGRLTGHGSDTDVVEELAEEESA